MAGEERCAESKGEEGGTGQPERRIPTHTHTTPRVCVRVSSKTTTHMLLVSPRSKGVWAKSAADVQAYTMSFTFETFQLLKSPLKELAS